MYGIVEREYDTKPPIEIAYNLEELQHQPALLPQMSKVLRKKTPLRMFCAPRDLMYNRPALPYILPTWSTKDKKRTATAVDSMAICSRQGCSKKAGYGVEGAAKAELCCDHAEQGMVNLIYKCAHPGCG